MIWTAAANVNAHWRRRRRAGYSSYSTVQYRTVAYNGGRAVGHRLIEPSGVSRREVRYQVPGGQHTALLHCTVKETRGAEAGARECKSAQTIAPARGSTTEGAQKRRWKVGASHVCDAALNVLYFWQIYNILERVICSNNTIQVYMVFIRVGSPSPHRNIWKWSNILRRRGAACPSENDRW